MDQFDQSGDLIYAVNVGGGAFTFTNSVNPDIDFLASHADLDTSALDLTYAGFYANTTPSANNVLGSTGAYSNDLTGETVTMNNLVIGQEYLFQILLVDGRGGSNGRYAEFDSFTTSAYGNGVNNVTWGDSLLVTGTFTADADSQSFFFDTLNQNGSSAGGQMNGFLLYSVPEPSSTALLGLAGVALLARRRR
ncbi:hypothetical protein Rhal01_00683 [Rubritalea halochordaticola]|uniref:Ice-binding protein C-terminal domain-containing protein n=1 Tax=Rubritalea halochordaticola TaxID=714537 RepID=A0ABP9UVN0_9BACT